MRVEPLSSLACLALAATFAACASVAPAPYGIGRSATQAEIGGWDIDVLPDGAGLPLGSGSVQIGLKIYETKCAMCHGPKGEGADMDQLVGGRGTLATSRPIKTVGSYWPYATTLFDYVRRAMPFNAPQTLTADEVYAICAYLLHLNGIIMANEVMDAKSLPLVQMPNRYGFVSGEER